MTEICPPVRLPINIETSCGPRPDCLCGDNDKSCSVNSIFSSQGSYQNECSSVIQKLPSIQIAFLSNVRNDCNPNQTVNLNPISISWCDFLTLFYHSNNVFNISPSNNNLCAINFANQTFENVTNKKIKLNLAQQIRSAWADKCETTVDNIPVKTNILLNKDVFGVKSLLNSASSISLTLDQAIETLLVNGDISPGDSTTSADVRFIIQYKYCFKPLDTCVLINFVFVTKIPCYKNENLCDDWCPPYSNDKNCRNCCDLSAETNDIALFLDKNFKNHEVDDETISNDSEAMSQLKDLNMTIDDTTQVSIESSRW